MFFFYTACFLDSDRYRPTTWKLAAYRTYDTDLTFFSLGNVVFLLNSFTVFSSRRKFKNYKPEVARKWSA